MADESIKLSDQFYSTRLTAMLMSVVLFGVSVSTTPLTKLKIFDVEFTGIHQRFIIVALLLAATLSITSLWLKFFNEGAEVLRRHVDLLTRRDFPATTVQQLSAAAADISGAISGITDFVNGSEVRALVNSGRDLPDALFAEALFQRLGTMTLNDPDLHVSIQGLADNLAAQGVSAISIDALRTQFSMMMSDRQDRVDAVLRDERANFPDGAILVANHFRGTIAQGTARVVEAGRIIERARAEIVEHRKFAQKARHRMVAEVSWFGTFIPTAIYAVAMLHSIGALGWRFLPSLPDAVDHVLAPQDR